MEQALRQAGDDPADQLVAVVAEVADRIREPYFRGCPFRNHLTECTDRDCGPARICRDYLVRWRTWTGVVAGRLDVDDPDGLADRIWLVMEGLYVLAAHPVDERSGDTAVTFVREIIDRAVADHRR